MADGYAAGLLIAFGGWLAYLLLYPSAVVAWGHRRLLRRWVSMTIRHPLLMLESAREVHAENRATKTTGT